MGEAVQSRIEIDVRSTGANPDALARSLDRLTQSEGALVSSTEKLTKVRERNEASIDRLAKKYDEEYRMAQNLAREMSILERARSAGLGGTEAFERAHAGLTKAMNDNAKAAGLARHEWVNLGRQAQDAITMLAMGSSPMQVLTSQGAQIADVFSSSRGGAGAALKEFAGTVGRGLLNPVTLAAAAFGTAAYATLQWQKQVDALTVSLNGLGRASGLTREGANAIAERAAAASGISGGAARGLAAQYLGAGVGAGALGGAIGVTRDFGRKLGMSEDDAAKTLAGALADPARGAEELAKKFGLLSYAQREEIAQTQAMGDKAGAAAKLVEDLHDRLDKMADPTWAIIKAFDKLKDTLSDSALAWGELISDPLGYFKSGKNPRQIEEERRAQQALIGAKLDEGLARQLGIDKLASDAAFAAREITAESFAQREAIVMEKGRMQALLDTKNATQHLMEAEAERLRMLAEAQRKVEDYTRQADREIALSKAKTPYERGRLQIIQEGQELLRQIPDTMRKVISVPRAHQQARPHAEAFDGGINDLVAEAARRGLEPTESTFQKLMDEGIGNGHFRGRMIRMDEMSRGPEDGFSRSTINVPNINAGRMRDQARGKIQERLDAFEKAQSDSFFDKINDDLERQNALLNAEEKSFGKSTAAIERARKEQELLNQAKQLGLPLTSQMKKEIGEEADKYGDLAQRQEEQRKHQQGIIDSLDEIRGASRDMASGMINDFRQGATGAKVMENALDRLLSKILDASLNGVIDNLFGKQGSPNGGIFANLFGNMFGGGGFGGIFGGIGRFFGMDTGGVIGVHGRPMLAPISAFAGAPSYDKGGTIGTPVPMIGHVGEIVLNAAMQRNTAAALSAAQSIANNSAPKTQNQQMPKMTFIDQSSGVVVTPQRMSDGEIVMLIENRISANNKRQGEAARRSA